MKTNPTKKKKKTPLQKLRFQVSHEANRQNQLLREIREKNPAWLYRRWDSYLYEHGTKRENLFRRTTSSMNTAQLKEYRALLYSFEEDMRFEEEIERQYSEHFQESDISFLRRVEDLAYDNYFKYFPPSEKEAKNFANTVKSSVQARLNDRDYMQGKDHADIIKELYDALKSAGDIKDPKQGDSTKFRDIFTVREMVYNGNREIKRFL